VNLSCFRVDGINTCGRIYSQIPEGKADDSATFYAEGRYVFLEFFSAFKIWGELNE
jgi:hypothetical protein